MSEQESSADVCCRKETLLPVPLDFLLLPHFPVFHAASYCDLRPADLTNVKFHFLYINLTTQWFLPVHFEVTGKYIRPAQLPDDDKR